MIAAVQQRMKHQGLERLHQIKVREEKKRTQQFYTRTIFAALREVMQQGALAVPMDLVVGRRAAPPGRMEPGFVYAPYMPVMRDPTIPIRANGRTLVKVYKGPGYPTDPSKEIGRLFAQQWRL